MDAVQRFAGAVDRPGGKCDLLYAALCLSGIEGVEPDERHWAGVLEELAAGLDSVSALRARLFDELGFAGDTDEYDAPRNSFLPEVLTRRRGLPISLTLVATEVARRAGLDVRPIAMPGHMLAKDGATGEIFDPYFGGGVLDRKGCEARFRQATGAGPEMRFDEALLPEADDRDVISRMLENLIRAYQRRGKPQETEVALRMRQVLPGWEMRHLLALGEAIAAQGHVSLAAQELEDGIGDSQELSAPLKAAARALRARLN